MLTHDDRTADALARPAGLPRATPLGGAQSAWILRWGREAHAVADRTAFGGGVLRRATAWGFLAALVAGLLLWVDPMGGVIGELGQMDPFWLLIAVGLELASCASYVVVFRGLFEPGPAGTTRKPAWVGLGAGAVLPGGDVTGAAVSGLLLHRDGVPKRRVVERSSVLVLLINAGAIAAAGIAGALLLSGGVAGPHDALRAGLPVLLSAAVFGVVAAVPFVLRRPDRRAPGWAVQLANVVVATERSLRQPNWRLLGAVGYPLLDMAALWAVCAATGHAPSYAALIIAYHIGYLASILPIPAGIGVLDGGLASALILYGVSPSVALAAVLVYHALAVSLPSLGGLAAWVLLRREHNPLRTRAAVASID
jgi:uncharacterized membrane protein YbhN (UPF0104 family)